MQGREGKGGLKRKEGINMTAKKAIELLSKMNPKAELKMHDRFGEPVLFVVALANDDSTAWLECESDNDMKAEIESRFESAAEEWSDEADFYMDLLEIGIDVNMVRKYMGKEVADHMESYCKEHGLI